MKNIPVYFVGSSNLTSQTAVAMVSMAMNTKSYIDFYIMDCDLTQDDIRALQSICAKYSNIKSLIFINVDISIFAGCNTWRGHIDVWARFLFPELAPNIGKAIYLDSDIVIMNDIQELYDLDLEEKAVAAAPEIWHLSRQSEQTKIERQKKFGYSENHIYFGSGTLVLDCEKWREENIAQKIFEIGREWGEKLVYPDQDALNIYFADNYKVIDNELVSTSNDIIYLKKDDKEKFLRLQKNIIVRHFNVYKPFSKEVYISKNLCPHLENWWYYASLTPYYPYFLHKLHIEKSCNYIVRLFGLVPFIKIKRNKRNRRVILLFDLIPLAIIK
ncbi:MAG: glycosyltransferase family 8 protein [Rickettsiales bacterium]|jgi:lipopolysaccharide biosynthesis glycosyltransferase|nr:glycosyltransferase family 8 protein [Rickettsiales bacterium]